MAESLIIRIGAKANEFDKELKKLQQKTASLEKGLAKTAQISAVAFAGLATAVAGATQRFASFERSFTNVQTLLDKSSFSTKSLAEGVKGLRDDVLALGADSGESFENLNQGLFDLISAGVPAEEATAALTDAVNLANAGATDTATSVKALTAAVTAFGRDAGSTTEIAQKFFTAQKFGVTTVGELSNEFNKVGGLAKQLGISFNEALAASTALTANGAKPTAQAFTEFRAVLNSVILAQGRLAGESAAVQDALSLQNIEQKGIVAALGELQTATGGNVVTLQRLLGSSEALSAALSLTGQQAGTFDTILTNLNDEQARTAAFNDALATKQETTEKAFARLTRSVEAITIQLGERFAPLITQVADAISGLAKDFNELSDEQKDNIANFIQIATVVAGAATAVTTLGLGLIKARRFLVALSAALKVGRLAAIGFTGALTGGLSLVIGFLPEIISGVKTLLGLFNKGEDPKSLTEINSELDTLKKRQDEIINSPAPSEYARQQQLEGVNEEIAKLEELRQKQLELSNQQETGSLLIRPESDGSDPFAGLDEQLTGQKAVEVPLKVVPPEDDGAAAVEQVEKKKTEVIDKATADRIQKARDANEILQAEQIGVSEEEIGFIRRRNELEQQEREAQNIRNKELRQQELENIRLQQEALLLEEEEFRQRRAEEIAIAREQDLALQDELAEIDADRRAQLNEQELTQLRGSLLTQKQAKAAVAKEEAQENIRRRNQFLKDEERHGTAVAKLNEVLSSQEVQGVRDTSAQLAQLQNSKNAKLKAIGKRAAQAQIAIDTARGAVAAYTSLSGIPLIGPALGAAAAAALIAYGAERINEVNAAQRGGIIQGTTGSGSAGLRDRVPVLAEPGEIIVPRALAPDFIQSVGRPDPLANEEQEGGDSRSVVLIEIEDEAADMITARQRENTDLAIGVAV